MKRKAAVLETASPVWNEGQLDFIHQPFESHGKLVGIPGAGKTTTILQRCEHWKRQLQLDGHNFLILMFSKQACNDFKAKAKQLKLKGYTDNNVRTIHSLAGSILHKAGVMCALQTCVINATDALTPELVPAVAAVQNVRNVIVDEAQDLSAEQYGLVMKVATLTGCFVTMVGDPDQAIFGFQGGSKQYLLGHPGYTVHLTINYRCKPPIVHALNQVRDTSLPPMISAQGAGACDTRPLLVHADMTTLADQLVQHVGTRYTDHVVAVLGPVKLARPAYDGSYKCLGLQWAAQVLREKGVPVTVHYMEGNESFNQSTKAKDKACLPGTVHLFTLHGSKGLEFDTVVALNFHTETMGSTPGTAAEFEEKQNLWRVGMSRAKVMLYLYTMQGKHPWYSYTSLRAHVDVQGLPLPTIKPWKEWKSKNQPVYPWVSDVLNNRDIMPERCLAELEKVAAVRVEPMDALFTPSWTEDDLPNWCQLAAVYGMWAESVVYAALTPGQYPRIYEQVFSMLYHRIVVPEHLRTAMEKLLKNVGNVRSDGLVHRMHLTEEAFGDSGPGQELRALTLAWCDANPDIPHLFLAVSNIVQHYDEVGDKQWLQGISTNACISSSDMWKLCLYRWQHVAEAGYRWFDDYTATYAVLESIYPTLYTLGCMQQEGKGYSINPMCTWKNLPVLGEPDIVCTAPEGAHVIELKFSPYDSVMHYLQVWGYALMLDVPKVEVWNLMTGKRGQACWDMDTLGAQRQACEALLTPLLCSQN